MPKPRNRPKTGSKFFLTVYRMQKSRKFCFLLLFAGSAIHQSLLDRALVIQDATQVFRLDPAVFQNRPGDL